MQNHAELHNEYQRSDPYRVFKLYNLPRLPPHYNQNRWPALFQI